MAGRDVEDSVPWQALSEAHSGRAATGAVLWGGEAEGGGLTCRPIVSLLTAHLHYYTPNGLTVASPDNVCPPICQQLVFFACSARLVHVLS